MAGGSGFSHMKAKTTERTSAELGEQLSMLRKDAGRVGRADYGAIGGDGGSRVRRDVEAFAGCSLVVLLRHFLAAWPASHVMLQLSIPYMYTATAIHNRARGASIAWQMSSTSSTSTMTP